MLSRKEKEFLNQKYPLIKPLMLFSLLPALVLIVALTFVFVHGKTDLLGYLITSISGVLIFVASLLAFLFPLFHRYGVRRRCVGVTHGMAIRVDKKEFDERSYNNIYEFAREVVVYDVVGMVLGILSPFASVRQKRSLPMIFVTIKELGNVYLEYSKNSSFYGVKRRVSGVQKGQWCQIEWNGYRSRARKLLLHEVAHAILSCSKAKYGREKQHSLIQASEVEKILELKEA